MRDRVIFFVLAAIIAIVFSVSVGAGAVAVCYLAGLTGSSLVAVFGATVAAVFSVVVALASLAAKLFFP